MANVKIDDAIVMMAGKEMYVALKPLLCGNNCETSKDYVERGPFALVRDDSGTPLQIYNKPVYSLVAAGNDDSVEEDNCADTLLHTGRRWYETVACRKELL